MVAVVSSVGSHHRIHLLGQGGCFTFVLGLGLRATLLDNRGAPLRGWGLGLRATLLDLVAMLSSCLGSGRELLSS